MRRSGAKRGADSVRSQALLSKKSWKPLPAIALLGGDADFFKEEIIQRFRRELFGSDPADVQRFQGPSSDRDLDDLPLSTVLDELRTPSFLSPRQLIIVDRGSAFVAAHREILEKYVEKGFGGGHLIIALDDKAAKRTRFGKAIAAKGWFVECDQPYDRPPPWETRTPLWDSELSHWLVRHAKKKGLVLDPETAFVLHDRVGTDLAVLDEELEKIATYIAETEAPATGNSGRRVTAETIRAVTGELREHSIFQLVDMILEERRAEALESVERLFERGYHADSGALVIDPTAIALPLVGTMVHRLRALRRAHAMAEEGASSDEWIREKLVQRPFLPRFQRQLRTTPPGRIRRLFDRLYRLDASLKRGGSARHLLALLAAE